MHVRCSLSIADDGTRGVEESHGVNGVFLLAQGKLNGLLLFALLWRYPFGLK